MAQNAVLINKYRYDIAIEVVKNYVGRKGITFISLFTDNQIDRRSYIFNRKMLKNSPLGGYTHNFVNVLRKKDKMQKLYPIDIQTLTDCFNPDSHYSLFTIH